MFSGIVQGIGTVADRSPSVLWICLPGNLAKDLQLGASVAVDGVCLTAAEIREGNTVRFDISDETRQVTTLDQLPRGGTINIERSLRFGDEIGGHLVSGHVHFKGEIALIEAPPAFRNLVVKIPQDHRDFVLPKGFIAIDGISLTVCESEAGTCSFALIPETWERTTLKEKSPGDFVNVEVDQMTRTCVETTKRFLKKT